MPRTKHPRQRRPRPATTPKPRQSPANPKLWVLASVLIVLVLIASISLYHTLLPYLSPLHGATATQTLQPLPLKSRGLPAFTNDDCHGASPASNADDGSYTTVWRSCAITPSAATPVWLAYRLHNAQLAKTLLLWTNDPTTNYDYTKALVPSVAHNLPADYTIEASTTASTDPPSDNWITLVAEHGNTLHSRQYTLDLSRYQWIRMNITKVDDSAGNTDVLLNLDLHDATQGNDDWLFLGDSITEEGMAHTPIQQVDNLGNLIHAQAPQFTPVFENGGIGALASGDGLKLLPDQLRHFPGRFVSLNYGTNDANGCVTGEVFEQHLADMIQIVIAAGKIPLLPKIPASQTTNVVRCGPAINQAIDRLYARFPQLVPGPDFWDYFSHHPDQLSADHLHPTADGYAAMRQLWRDTLLQRVYQVPVSHPFVTPVITPAALSQR